jgi:hypothetical protein
MPPLWFLKALDRRNKRPSHEDKPRPKNSTSHTGPTATNTKLRNFQHDSPQKFVTSVDLTAINQADGKTHDCDRTHTFDSFLDGEHVSAECPQERAGRRRRVWRTLNKLLSRGGKERTKERARKSKSSWFALMVSLLVCC